MGKLAGISELNYRERKVSEEYFSMREGGRKNYSKLKVLEITNHRSNCGTNIGIPNDDIWKFFPWALENVVVTFVLKVYGT